MGKKNNGGIVVLTGIIIVILVILCILFATNTISVNYNSAKETTSQKKDNQQDNNDENDNNSDSSNDVKLNDAVSLYNVYQKEDSSLFNICSDFNCDISVKYSNLSDFINGLMKKNEIIEIAKSDKSILENDIYNIPFTEIKNEGESNFYNIYIANNNEKKILSIYIINISNNGDEKSIVYSFNYDYLNKKKLDNLELFEKFSISNDKYNSLYKSKIIDFYKVENNDYIRYLNINGDEEILKLYNSRLDSLYNKVNNNNYTITEFNSYYISIKSLKVSMFVNNYDELKIRPSTSWRERGSEIFGEISF